MCGIMGISVTVKEARSNDKATHALSSEIQILELLERLDFNLETVVVKRNGKIVPEEEKLEDGDEIEVVPVVSGG